METSKMSYFPAATPWQRMGIPSISITALPIQVSLWRTAAFARSWAGWMPTAIRNTVEIDVTNELFAGLPQHPRFMHSHRVFSLGESCALDDLKRFVDRRIDALATPLLSARNK